MKRKDIKEIKYMVFNLLDNMEKLRYGLIKEGFCRDISDDELDSIQNEELGLEEPPIIKQEIQKELESEK